MGSGALTYVAVVKETSAGVVPTSPVMQKIRNTGGSGITNDRASVTSSEMRSDRQITSSRSGGNKPGLSVPFELAYGDQDYLIASAFGSYWVGNYDLTIDVDFGDGDGTITTDDGTDWEDYDVAVGDYITIANAATAGNDGIYYISAIVDDEMTVTEVDGTTAVTFTVADADEVSIKGGWYGGRIDTSTYNLTVNATNNTITSGASLFDTTYMKKGDYLVFEGFAETENNGAHKLLSVTDTVLAFEEDETFVAETITTGDVDYVTKSAFIKCGVDMPTYTFEEGFTDISEYHYIRGAKADSFSLSIQPDAIVTGECQLKGTGYSGMTTTPITGATYLAEGDGEVFDTYSGDLFIDGSVEECRITGMDFSISNNLSERMAIMKRDLCSLGEGRTNATGTISAYFSDGDFSRLYYEETTIATFIRMKDPDDNAYGFGMPRIKFTSDSRDKQENDVTQSIGYQALGGDEVLSTAYMVKQMA